MSDAPAERPSPVPHADDHDFIGYADFGRRFFEAAVTQRRVEKAAAGLAGRPVEFGPRRVGPIGLVQVQAAGSVGRPAVERRDDPDHIAFALTVPIDLQLTIEIGIDKNRFHADVLVRLELTARAAAPLLIVIDIAEPTSRDVEVDLQADGVRASVLKLVARIDGELRRTVAKLVRRELDHPSVRRARVIDVGAAVESIEASHRD